MAHAMTQGSMIVDIAAERGGNCELTHPDEIYEENGVTIMGPVNLPSSVPRDASQLYAANVTAFLKLLAPKGELVLNREDQIIQDTLVTYHGEVVNKRVRELLGKAQAVTS